MASPKRRVVQCVLELTASLPAKATHASCQSVRTPALNPEANLPLQCPASAGTQCLAALPRLFPKLPGDLPPKGTRQILGEAMDEGKYVLMR